MSFFRGKDDDEEGKNFVFMLYNTDEGRQKMKTWYSGFREGPTKHFYSQQWYKMGTSKKSVKGSAKCLFVKTR